MAKRKVSTSTATAVSANQRRLAFARALFVGETESAAAVSAGYRSGPGIRALASKLARDPAVVAELERLQARARARAEFDAAEAVQILTAHARGNLGDFLSFENGVPKLDLAQAQAAKRLGLVKELRVGPDGEVKIKLHDVQSAIRDLANLLGFAQPQQHTVTVAGESVCDDDLKRILALAKIEVPGFTG